MNFKTLAVSALLAVTAASAYAYTRYHTTVYYFSDASHSTLVGVKVTNCYNKVEVDGTVTPYSRIAERFSCDGPIP